jgi:hypothetical protein
VYALDFHLTGWVVDFRAYGLANSVDAT